MRLLSMALRNLGRNRRRTLLAASSVFFSMVLILMMDGMVSAFIESIIRNYTKNESGHISITTDAYRESERFSPVDEYIEDPLGVEAAISSIPELEGKVELIARRIRFGVLLSSGSKTKYAVCIAGDPELETKLMMLDRSVQEPGSYLSGKSRMVVRTGGGKSREVSIGEVLIGYDLAESLSLEVGQELKGIVTKADGGAGFLDLMIVGIFRTGVNSLDGNIFQVGIQDAQGFLSMEGGSQQVIVMLKKASEAGKAARLIETAFEKEGLDGLSVQPWTESGSFASFVGMTTSIYFWFLLVLAFLGAFIIANVMMMVVLERKRETGILKSLGMPKRDILGLFVMEGAIIGFGGSLAGALAGCLLVSLIGMKSVGLDMTGAMKGFSWPMDNVIYPVADIGSALGYVLMGTIVAAVLSFLPAWKAARMKAVEGIRSV